MHHKWQSYNAWFLTYEAWQTEFVLILGHFLPFYPTNNPKNQNFKKIKKSHGYIIILHKCTKNHDHMLYCSWDMVRNGWNCSFPFWANFCPFTPLTSWKIKILKKMKKTPGDIMILHMHQKLWSDDAQLLRYGVRWMDRQMDG